MIDRDGNGEADLTAGEGDTSQPWVRLAVDYETARAREDSLDRLVEWPAQRSMIGDVDGLTVLDMGCGNGGKLTELVEAGAVDSMGVDISGNFLARRPSGMTLVQGDLSAPELVPELNGRKFDRILFLQSFGYAADPVHVLTAVRSMLADDNFMVLSRTQPLRYALERCELHGTALGEEYFANDGTYSYRSGWNDQITLTQRPYRMSDLLNVFSDAGWWIEITVEPRLSETDAIRFPHKKEWMDKYLGILLFKLRPRTA